MLATGIQFGSELWIMRFRFIAPIAVCLMLPSCVSAWMTGATGVTLKPGMERAEVHKKLGAPSYTTTEGISGSRTFHVPNDKIRFIDVHIYRGKLNAVDEGSGQATGSALTLGAAEAIMIPMTAAEIAIRSAQRHQIDISYGSDSRVLDYSAVTLPAD